MSANKGLISYEYLYADHISENDIPALESFAVNNPAGQGLLDYIRDQAIYDEQEHTMRTYLVKDMDSDEIVGYFSLKAGMVSHNETQSTVYDPVANKHTIVREFDTYPGIELADFAVNSTYTQNNPYAKGIGYIIFSEFVLPMVRMAEKIIGVKVLYIFALPYETLIRRYEFYGFRRLPEEQENVLHTRLKPRYDESCKFMYMMLN